MCAWWREEFGKTSFSIALLKKEDVVMRCGSKKGNHVLLQRVMRGNRGFKAWERQMSGIKQD